MAVNNLAFVSAVDDWVKSTEQRMTAVWKESTQRLNSVVVANLSGGVVNVQTGFLRASERASTEAMPTIDPTAQPKDEQSYSFDEGQITTVIASATLGQTIYLGWTAAYAGHVNWGTANMAPRRYVDLAAEQWQVIVNGVVADAKSRV
ncbi:hypothetical protein [Bradyrhizobium sp. URHD0069]|uniref:hypothetical protein n=1 Tax=Bradyrhizobium sp. URHD0069 TaxID=1380355 RepID=UPI000495A283|nr:hypothetical protein [Bradyrhizobium sp. URHD0069]